jgi:hypothetical protein
MCIGEMQNGLSPVEWVERIIPERIERLADGLVQFAEVQKQTLHAHLGRAERDHSNRSSPAVPRDVGEVNDCTETPKRKINNVI